MTDLIDRAAAIDARCPDIFAEMVWRGHDSQGQSIIFERSKGMKLRTKLKRAKEENEWLRGQLLMQYMNPGKVCCFDRKRVERVERVKLRNVRRIRTDDLPTADAVEVVRCKDCKYWDIFDIHSTICPNNKRCKGIIGKMYTGSNFYCAYGERNDE